MVKAPDKTVDGDLGPLSRRTNTHNGEVATCGAACSIANAHVKENGKDDYCAAVKEKECRGRWGYQRWAKEFRAKIISTVIKKPSDQEVVLSSLESTSAFWYQHIHY